MEKAGRSGKGIKAGEVARALEKALGKKAKEMRVEKTEFKVKGSNLVERVWLDLEKGALREAVEAIFGISRDAHFAVASGFQKGEKLVLNYHFSVGFGEKEGEICISVKVELPAKKPVVPTITDLVPGALISERELQEMLGVKVKGIPDARRLFLDESFPKGVFPWRRDKTSPNKMVRDLNKGGNK